MSAVGFTPIQLYRSTTASAVPTSGNLADGELAINTNDGKLYYKDSGGAVQLIASKAGASGDVVGPASATDNAVVRFDGTSGKLVQNSVVTIADSTGDVAGVGALTASGNLTLSGGTANGVLYLNGSKVATSGSAVTYNGTTFATSADASISGLTVGKGAGAVSTNTAVGASALNNNTTGSYNQAVGVEALRYNTDGIANTALGAQAAITNTSGGRLVALGNSALYANTTGSYNTAVGVESLRSNTTASYNTAVGYQAGYSTTTGQPNNAFGAQALFTNTTGTQNSAVGTSALYANTTGSNNTGIGNGALQANTTASNNTAVGYQAAYSNTTGAANTAVGNQAGYTVSTGNYNSSFGHHANRLNTGSLNTVMGGLAFSASGAGQYNSAFGYTALNANTSGNANVAIGGGDGATYNGALGVNTTGSYNVAVGNGALQANTTASNNTAVGYQAGYSNTTGTANTYLGEGAGFSNTTSSYNTFIGEAAGRSFNTSGNSGNTFVGVGAGYGTTTGTANTFVGAWNPATTVGCGQLVTTGSKNTILGGYNGNQGGLDIRTASNYIVLSDGDGNPRVIGDNSGNVMIGATTNTNATKLLVGGKVGINNAVINAQYNYTDVSGTTFSLWRIGTLAGGGGGDLKVSMFGTDVLTPNAAQYQITFSINSTNGGVVAVSTKNAYTANNVYLVKDSTYLYLACAKGQPNGAGYWTVELVGSVGLNMDLSQSYATNLTGYTTVYTV